MAPALVPRPAGGLLGEDRRAAPLGGREGKEAPPLRNSHLGGLCPGLLQAPRWLRVRWGWGGGWDQTLGLHLTTDHRDR